MTCVTDALIELPIHIDAEAGAGGCVDLAVGVDDGEAGQAVAQMLEGVIARPVERQHLEPIAVVDRHRNVEVGDVVHGVVAIVDLAGEVERLGKVGDLHQARDSSFDDDVAAQVVGRLAHDPVGKRRQSARRHLGRHQRNPQVLFEPTVAVDVQRREWILVPEVTQLLDLRPNFQCGRVRVAPGRIEHQCHLVAHLVADPRTGVDIEGDRRRGVRAPRRARRVELVPTPPLLAPIGRLVGVVLCTRVVRR